MSVEPSEMRELFDRECQFPTDRDAVVDAVGDVAIASPGGASTDVASVLARADATTFASARELHSTVMANLASDHVGREGYDDRSSTRDHDDVSF